MSSAEQTVPERLNSHRYREGWLWVLSIITVITLFGTVLLFIRDAEQNQQRERDRIEFDKGSCERGNANRQVNKQIAEASANLDRHIIELLVSNNPRVNQEQIDFLLAPAFAEYQKEVDKIQFVNCDELLRQTDGS